MKKEEVLFGLMAALFLALAFSPFASSWPDGLERVAADKGFLHKAEGKAVFSSPVPGYAWPHFKNEKLATPFAGIFGTLLVFGLGYGLAACLMRKK